MRRYCRISAMGLGALAGLWLAMAPVQAQPAADLSAADLAEMPIEQLMEMRVTSASRFEQSRHEAPSAVAVITAADIQAYGWRTLADALGSLPGLYTSYDRSYHYLGARGFLRAGDYNTRFLLLVDGVRLNDSLYDQAPVGTDFILDLDLVERIEYVPGPGSAVYGSNALFGVINVITRSGAGRQPELALAAGSDGLRRGRATLGWSGGDDASLLLSASRYDYDGADLYFAEYDTPEQNGGVAEGLDHDRATQLFAKGRYGGWTVSLAHSDRLKGVPTANYEQWFNDDRATVRDQRTTASVHTQWRWSGASELSARAYFGDYRYDGDYIYEAEPALLNRDLAQATQLGLELQAMTTAVAGQKLLAGASFDRIEREQANFDLEPYTDYLDDRRVDSRIGLYLQDEIRLSEQLLANLGLRYDRYSATGSNSLNPRAALIYQPAVATTVKALYGTAYRAPNAYELYYELRDPGGGPGSQLGNAELRDEHIRTTELVLEQRLAGGISLSGSLYRYRIRDLISLATDEQTGAVIYRNLDQADATGIELVYEQRWQAGAALRGSYSLQRARNASADHALENSPRHLVKLNLASPLPRTPLTTGLEVRNLSQRLGQDDVRVSSYWLTNLSLRWPDMLRGTDASLTLYNLFDQHYEDPPGPDHLQSGIEQDGRTALAKLVVRF